MDDIHFVRCMRDMISGMIPVLRKTVLPYTCGDTAIAQNNVDGSASALEYVVFSLTSVEEYLLREEKKEKANKKLTKEEQE